MVSQGRRRNRKFPRSILSEEKSSIPSNRSIQRRRLLEVRNKLAQPARIHNRPRKLMRPNFPPLLKHINILSRKRGRFSRSSMSLNQIGEVQSTGQASGPSPNNQNVSIQSFPRHPKYLAHSPSILPNHPQSKSADATTVSG